MLEDDRHGLEDPSPGDDSRTDRDPSSVLLVTPRWVRDGGVSAHVKASAEALAGRGLRVEVLVAARVETDAPPPGVTIWESPELFNSRASMSERLGEAVSSGPALIHLHQVDDPEIVSTMRASAPVVISAHGYTACTSGVYYFNPGHECTRGHGPGCVPNLLARGCAHTDYPKTLPRKYRNATRGLAALRRADLAVSYSHAVDRHLAANRITRRTVVPYFPTMTAKPGSGHAHRRRVVFAGRIARPKGVGVLIEAARDVDAEFVICGDGMQLPAMRELAERLGVAQRVCFKGWLDADQLAEELANASVVVVPSLWPEPFGLVGIEALAAGRPAVASSTGGIGEWLEHGVSGLCVAPGDAPALALALTELLADPDRQSEMGIAGREAVAARFSPARHLAALLDGYRSARSTWDAERAGSS
jgi:glycosyltransferase involved in cell wall biosynthesis